MVSVVGNQRGEASRLERPNGSLQALAVGRHSELEIRRTGIGKRDSHPQPRLYDRLRPTSTSVVPIYANPDAATLARCADNQARERTRVHIQRVYELDEAAAALADFAQGTLGKLVIVVD